jgi:hypothetical protein
MFFRAAQQRGYRFAWTSTAKVTETVLSQKLALTWVMRRALRQGATYAKIRVQGISPLRQIFFIAEICVVIWFYTGLLFLVLVAGPRACVYVLSKLLSNIGKIIGLLFYALFEPGGSHDQ